MLKRAVLMTLTLAMALVAPWLWFADSLNAQKPPAPQDRIDLALILAVDISYSMDPEEQRMQRMGYVEALRSPDVQRAIVSGRSKKIAIAYMEWAGRGINNEVLPWTIIDSADKAREIADFLEGRPIQRGRMTSISGALEVARDMFKSLPYKVERRVVDVSGDGPNNNGPPVTRLRNELIEDGIVINGLPFMVRPSGPGNRFDLQNLDLYYEECVIGGTGSFSIPIYKREEIISATRRKMLLEIAGLTPDKPAGVVRVQQSRPLPPLPPHANGQPPPNSDLVDCMIGERMWQRFYGGP
jgi:hypothetical protein